MVVDVGLNGGVLSHLFKPVVQVGDHIRRLGVGVVAEFAGLLAGGLQPLAKGFPVLGAGEAQRRFHLRQQVLVEELGDLRRLQVHDPIQAEVQVAPVKLEHLAQQRPQPVELLVRAGGGGLFSLSGGEYASGHGLIVGPLNLRMW